MNEEYLCRMLLPPFGGGFHVDYLNCMILIFNYKTKRGREREDGDAWLGFSRELVVFVITLEKCCMH